MNPQKQNEIDTRQEQRYACLVNRKTVIDTLESKANLTGFRYIRKDPINTEFIEKKDRKGEFLCYEQTTPIEILDVDGKIKKTVKTSYYQQDKDTQHKKPSIGVYTKYLAARYHGTKSRNWKQAHLTLQEIIDELNSGYAIAPGEFQPEPDKSIRKAEYCMSRQVILFDADEWTPEHPAPADISELIERYPNITNDFFWIGESISSRSSLKPELRCRLMLVLPTPIRQGESDLWQTAIDSIVDKYPFIARGVGIDKVRLSFGNARPECENRILQGFISQETFETWKKTASHKAKQAELDATALAEQKERQDQARQRNQHTRIELKKRGYQLTDQPTDPLVEFCKADPATLLTNHGIATHLNGSEWNFTGSGAGRSLVLENGIIKPFSNSAQAASPAASTKDKDKDKDIDISPVNAHRYIAYILYKLDISKDSDQRQLRCELANIGYGTHPDVYKEIKRQEKVLAVREGLENPLSLRPAAPPLPTQERLEVSISTLQDNAKEIAKAFREQKRIVALQAGTGEGKTENAIAYAIDGGELFMTLNSIPLAEEVHQRFTNAKTNAFLWRSRYKGYTTDIEIASPKERIKLFQNREIICIKPEMIVAARQKGLQPKTVICNQCEVQDKCHEYGYYSQKNKARNTQVLCVAMPKAFTDPASKQFYTDLTVNKSDNLINVIDEVKTHDLFITCNLSKQQLYEWLILWEGKALSDFAEKALTLLNDEKDAYKAAENALNKIENKIDAYKIAELVSKYTDKEIDTLSKQASRYNIAYKKVDEGAKCDDTKKTLANHSIRFDNDIKAYVAADHKCYDILLKKNQQAIRPVKIQDEGFITLTPEQTFKLGIFKTNTIQDINDIPSTYRSSDWTPFQQLKIFAERYQRKEDAPIEYKNDTLTWIIPPMIHPKIKKLICMSATLDETLFYRTFDSDKDKTTFVKTAPTKWLDGAKAYQIRTGAYPRRSLLEYSKESDYKDVISLSETGKKFLQAIETEIERDRNKKHVIITFNKIIEFESKRLTDTHPNLLGIHSFHRMEGLDYTDPNITFWILGTPDVKQNVVEHRAKMYYGNDKEPLNFNRDLVTRKYTDPRVQRCWENEVIARHIQSIGRGRLNRLPNTVILFSNVLIPDFTSKATGFVIEDLEVAGGLHNLTDVAKARLTAENDIRTAENPQAYQQTRVDREHERERKRQLKASRKVQAIKMHLAGDTNKKISGKLNIHRDTVGKWIKEHEKDEKEI